MLTTRQRLMQRHAAVHDQSTWFPGYKIWKWFRLRDHSWCWAYGARVQARSSICDDEFFSVSSRLSSLQSTQRDEAGFWKVLRDWLAIWGLLSIFTGGFVTEGCHTLLRWPLSDEWLIFNQAYLELSHGHKLHWIRASNGVHRWIDISNSAIASHH